MCKIKYHDGSGGRTLVRLPERKVSLKVDFMHATNLEEFLAGVIDGERWRSGSAHIARSSGVVELAHAVLDEVGVEWIMKTTVVTTG